MNELIEKLQEKLKLYDWYIPLRTFIFSEEFANIVKQLIEVIEDGRRFVPALKDIFNAFELCSYEKVQFVFVVDTLEKDLEYNKGVAIRQYKGNTRSPEHLFFCKAIKNSGYTYKKGEIDNVLFLHSSLTQDLVRTSNKHYKIWRPFITYLIDMLDTNKKCVFILIGDNAKTYKNVIKNNFYVEAESFPDSYYKQWNHNNIFNAINEHLETPVDWGIFLKEEVSGKHRNKKT